MSASDLKFHPLTSERWNDLERLFGKNGACGGCWCMSWRLSRSQFMLQRGEKNRKALKDILDSGEIPGILAYVDGEPAGWVSIAPREAFPRLEKSRVLKRVDDKPVWSVVCFFVAKPFRKKGMSKKLLMAAIDYVARNGGETLEGYPVEPKTRLPDPFVFTGLTTAFRQVGFVEALKRSERRPIMRYYIRKK